MKRLWGGKKPQKENPTLRFSLTLAHYVNRGLITQNNKLTTCMVKKAQHYPATFSVQLVHSHKWAFLLWHDQSQLLLHFLGYLGKRLQVAQHLSFSKNFRYSARSSCTKKAQSKKTRSASFFVNCKGAVKPLVQWAVSPCQFCKT